MRLALALTAACLAMLFVGGVNASPGRPFVGTWWAIDPSDGSLEQATFGAGGSMFYRDDLATSCGGPPAIAKDTGSVSGNVWTGTGNSTVYCVGIGPHVTEFFEFTLNPDGTLSSSVGDEVWTRSRP